MADPLQYEKRPGLSIIAMPEHMNPYMKLFSRPPIFGGWLLQNLISGCSNTAHDVMRANASPHRSLILSKITSASFLKPVLCGDNINVYGAVHPESEGLITVSGKMVVERQALGLHAPSNPAESRFGAREVAMSGDLIFKPVSHDMLGDFKNAVTTLPDRLIRLMECSQPVQRMAANSGDAVTSTGFMRAGWTLSHMDIAAALAANKVINPVTDLVVTGSVSDLEMQSAICYGDAVEIHTEVTEISDQKPWPIKVDVYALVRRSHKNADADEGPARLSIAGTFNMICLDKATMRAKSPVVTGSALTEDLRYWQQDHSALLMG